MTTGHSSNNLYSFEDPLGFDNPLSDFQSASSFGLSSWRQRSFDDSESDYSDDDDEADLLPQDKKQSPAALPMAAAQRETSACSSCSAPHISTRVRFSDHPEVCSYERVDREYYAVLFYSCHELQKMIDEAKNEKEAKTA